MQDKILYRNEWYPVKEYCKGYITVKDEIGNVFKIPDQYIQTPAIKFCYA